MGPTIGSARFAAWTSIWGAAIGVAITPFMAAVWAYEPGVVWADLSPLVSVVGPTLESWGALTFGNTPVFAADGTVSGESTAYEVYGKVFFLVYLLMLPVVRHVHALHRAQSTSKWEGRTWRVLCMALILACAGDAVSYWGISAPGTVGDTLWRLGFLIEIVAVLSVLVTTTMYGMVTVRRRVVPRWGSVLLMAVVPMGVLTLIGVTAYVPNAVVVPMSLVWAGIGAWMLLNRQPDDPTLKPALQTRRV